MFAWFSLNALLNLILLGMAFEALWLFWRQNRLGHGGPPPLLLHLVSGALLLVAMKLVLAGISSGIVMAVLSVAGIAHAADLWLHLTADLPLGTD